MTTYDRYRDAYQRQERDRSTWASNVQAVRRVRVTGRGSINIPFEFGLAYQGPPFFSYGVELASGALVPNDFPFVTAGVAGWMYTEVSDEMAVPLYTGAELFVGVWSVAEYDLIFTFVFEGIAFQNPQYTI